MCIRDRAYTRNGHLEVSTDGTVVSGIGLPVLSNGGAPMTLFFLKLYAAGERIYVDFGGGPIL